MEGERHVLCPIKRIHGTHSESDHLATGDFLIPPRNISGATLLLAATLLSACSKADNAGTDTSQTAVTNVPATTADTGMAGMDHSAMQTTPAKDADQEFLRMMVDHHQGLIEMGDTALAKNPSEHIRMDVREMGQKQRAEQKQMIGMLKSDYSEDKMPMVMPSNASMISEVASKSGADLEKTFRENVIKHHEEALKMIDDYLPKAVKPTLKSMATKMKSDQQKEIAELKKELSER